MIQYLFWIGAEHTARELHTAHPIDDRMVVFAVQGKLATVYALNEVNFPKGS